MGRLTETLVLLVFLLPGSETLLACSWDSPGVHLSLDRVVDEIWV